MAIVIIVIGLIALYLFMIFPSTSKRANAFKGIYFAHRGLHGDGVIENTLEAFKKAVENNYGMEFDVQLSKDNIAVINHDYSLKRVFNIDKKVSSLSAKELNKIGVPTLEQVLKLVDGKTPLLVEIKGESKDTKVCEVAAKTLDKYQGKWCVESFNPFYVKWFKDNRSNVVRGILSSRFSKKNSAGNFIKNITLRSFLLNFMCRPDFVAYEHQYSSDLSLRLQKFLGATLFAWTLRSKKEEEKIRKLYDCMIFEKYRP